MKAKEVVRKVIPYQIRKKIKGNVKHKKVNIYKKRYDQLDFNECKKVSVIIPNYNYEKFIEERIDSVLVTNLSHL